MTSTAAYADLAKAQAAMAPALKSAVNPHLKTRYADLASVLDACLAPLTAHGFCVVQPIGADEGGHYVETVLIHSSGERFSSRMYLDLPVRTMQERGSAVTYARRYTLQSLVALAAEDDDGHAASQTPASAQPKPRAQPQPQRQEPDDRRKAWLAKTPQARANDLMASLDKTPASGLADWLARRQPLIDELPAEATVALRRFIDERKKHADGFDPADPSAIAAPF